jgi:hypothetical protein
MAKSQRKTIREQLLLHKEKCGAVTIRREPLAPYSMGAFVVDVGKDLVLVLDVTDFSNDGFQVLRIRDFSRIERGGYEKVFERILRGEGIVTEVAAPFKIDLSNWRTAIGSVKSHSRNLIIEDDLFLVGRVTRLSTQTFSLRQFDALARWELSDRIIPYSRVTAITFNDRYSTLYSKYVRNPE